MTKDTARKTRTELPKEEIIKLVLARFATLQTTGKLTPYSELSSRDPAVVARAISRAIKREWVEVIVRPTETPLLERNEDLEEQLCEQFEGLAAARVVKRPETRQQANLEDAALQDDELHRCISCIAGEYIFKHRKELFLGEDVIGIGSGRGVSHLVDHLKTKMSLPTINVTLISLTGAIDARAQAGNPNLKLRDADRNLGEFSYCFGRRVWLERVSHPLAFESKTALEPALARTALHDDSWAETPLTHALIGVGVLGPGHRLWEEEKAKKKMRLLDPIMPRLAELVELSKEVRSDDFPHWYPVGDICNRLILLPPPTDLNAPQEKIDRIQSLIEEMNRRFLTVRFEQLQQARHIFLVGGTERKAPLLKRLLTEKVGTEEEITKPRYRIQLLATDEETAKLISGSRVEFRQSP